MGSSSKKRQRFYIELEPDETTIVSWKKLIRDAEKRDSCRPRLHSSPACTTPTRPLDDKANAGHCDDSSFRSGRYINRVTSPKNKQLSKTIAEMTKIKSEFMDDPTAKHEKTIVGLTKVEGAKNDSICSAVTGKPMVKMTKFERKNFVDPCTSKDVKSENFSMSVASEAVSPLNKAFSHTSTSAMVSDRQLKGLHDPPVLVYSKKSASYSRLSTYPPLPNVNGDASVFPFKTKDSLQQKTEMMSHEKSRTKTKLANDSLGAVHENSASGRVALSMNSQSMNLIDDKKTEVHSVVLNDHLIGSTRKTRVRRNAVPIPRRKSKVIDPGILANSSHPPVKRVKYNFSTERKMIISRIQSHSKEQNMKFSEKKNTKVRISSKQEHGDQMSKEQGAKKTLNHPRPAYPSICRQSSS